MFKLRKTKEIEASHQLPFHDGKCKRLHGHSWVITVEVQGNELHETGPKRGMVFDYYDIGVLMKNHVEILDHKHLNDIYKNPTSETIAKALFDEMAPHVRAASKGTARLSKILVSETRNSVAEYSE